jgi:hypothetical protein
MEVQMIRIHKSLLLGTTLSFFTDLLLLGGFLNDSDGDSLLHVSDGESSKRWELSESFDDHWLGWGHLDNGGITRLDEFWELFGNLTGSLVHLVFDLGELACDMACVAIEDWSVSVHDLTWMVHDDDLGLEVIGIEAWDVLGVGGNVASLDVGDGKTLDVESNIVSWDSFSDLLVMHLNRFDFSGDTEWSEDDGHTWLDDTGLDSSDWYSTNTRDLVDILEWESEWLESWSLWWLNGVEVFEKILPLVPWHVVGLVDHVITSPS